MENEVFDAFLKAIDEVFSETGIEISSVAPGDGERFPEQVITSIGLAGSVKGIFMVHTDYPSANNIVKSMLHGVSVAFQVQGLGEIQKTALGEMANQISGRAVTILSGRGIECGIAPPVIITAEKLTSHIPELTRSFTRIVKGPFGVLRLFIAIGSPA